MTKKGSIGGYRKNFELLFEDIYRKNFKKVLYFAQKYLIDIDVAESVTQDVFVALWGQIEAVDQNGEVLPYLFVMTKYRCLNHLRREKQHRGYIQRTLTDYDIAYAALTDGSSGNLYSSEVSRLINNAYANMPDKVKETFMCSRGEQLKNREIADKFNISEKTVEYRISCALKILRKHLKGYVNIIVLLIYLLREIL